MISPQLDELNGRAEVSDEVLMEAVCLGRQSAIEQLYQRHRDRLRGAIGLILRDETEAQDVLQETLLQLWNEAAKYSSKRGRPLAWLMTIAKRRAIDRVRRVSAYDRARDRFEVSVAQEPHSWLRSKVEADISRGDLRLYLKKELERLPPFQRQAVELAFLEGLSHREISVVTRTPLGTIKTRLELGLRKLAQNVRRNRKKI